MICRPSRSLSCAAIRRPTTSLLPPGGNGMISRTGLVGYCAGGGGGQRHKNAGGLEQQRMELRHVLASSELRPCRPCLNARSGRVKRVYHAPAAGVLPQRRGAGRSKLSRPGESRFSQWSGAANYCALMPASFTTRPHLAVSDAMNLPYPAGAHPHDLGALVRELLLHLGRVLDRRNLLVQLRDDGRRRAGRRDDADPVGELVAGQPGLRRWSAPRGSRRCGSCCRRQALAACRSGNA